MEILRTEHLVKKYGKGENKIIAVNDVSFSVEQGEYVAVVGSSGSGKSTLMHMLVWIVLLPAKYSSRIMIFIG